MSNFEAVGFSDVWSEVKISLYLFVESWGRFWSNRFRRDNDEILYLRTELSHLRQQYTRLAESSNSKETQEVQESREIPLEEKPIGGFIPWRMRVRQLEEESRKKKLEMEQTRKANEELEKELLNANG